MPADAPHQPDRRPRSPLLRLGARAVDWALPEQNPTAAIYGVILIGALLSAETPSRESYLDTISSALIAAALYWLAHSYARVLGGRLQDREPLSTASLAAALRSDWPLLRGAAVPLLALLVAALAGAGRGTAVSAAVWSAVASIAAFEAVAAVRSRATGGELAVEIAVGLTMGLGILAVKIVLH